MRRRLLLAALVAVALLSAAVSCDNPVEPTPTCSFTIAPADASFTSEGGTGSVAVTASESSCGWSATVTAAWITLSQNQGSGSGSLSYTVAANASSESRTAAVTVAGMTHTVGQAGRPPTPCTYEVTPLAVSFDSNGGSGSVSVNTAAGCAWTAATASDWIVVTAGAGGTGPGVVAFTADRNRREEARQAQLTVAGQTVVVVQAGEAPVCEYSVAPVQLNACLAPMVLSSMLNTTSQSCTWTVSIDAPWLTLTSPSAGSGPATITVGVSANYDAPRAGTIKVRWPTETAGQNIRVAQAGCRYAVSQDSFSFAAAGGQGEFFVFQQSDPTECGGPLQDGCIWSAIAGASWITITTPVTMKGDDRVKFTVAPNPTGNTRASVITVRDRTVTVIQTSAPSTEVQSWRR